MGHACQGCCALPRTVLVSRVASDWVKMGGPRACFAMSSQHDTVLSLLNTMKG